MVSEIMPDIDVLKSMKDESDIIVMFLTDEEAYSTSFFIYLKDVCYNKKDLFVLGSPVQIRELEKYIPKDAIAMEFERPFNSKDVALAINMLNSTDRADGKMREILIIDDDPVYLKAIKNILSDTYSVKAANSGMDGIAYISKHRPDLVLLDYEMPVVNGDTVIKMFDENEDTRDIPVIFLTGKDDRDTVMKLLELKPAGYLLKMQSGAEFPPILYLEIPMSESYKGKEIRIEYGNIVKDKAGVGRIFLGDKAAIIYSLVKKDAYTLVATVIVIMFGILSLIRYFSNGRSVVAQSKSYLYKGIAMILGALWLVNQTEAMEFFVKNSLIVTIVNYLSQIMLPIPFVLAVAYTEERKYFKSARIFCYATGVIDCIIFALITSGRVMIYDVFPLIDIPLNTSAVYTAGTIILILFLDKRLFDKMKSTIIALMILAVAAIIEIIGQNFTGFTGVALPTGIICFAVISEVVNSSDVIKTMKMDIEFNAYKRSQKALLASVSHEIRTPINAILGLDEMIMRETKEEDIKNYAEDIKTSGNVLLSLVNDILDFSKMESGMMVLIPEEYSLAELLNEVCIMAESKAKGKGLAFVTEINSEIPSKLHGDEARIRQILLNLLNNAVKYTKEGQVKFSVDYKEDGEDIVLIFHVIDTGIGIRTQDIPKIGMPFVRLDEQKNKSIEGTGLGMSITNNLLGMMGSKLLITSTYGKGSDFGCEIKQKVVDRAPIGDFKAAVKNDRKEDSAKILKARGKTFLVVDDTPMNLKVFKGLLKTSEADIFTASDGKEALVRCAERKYDIIFMDQRMPGMDGYETMRHIKYDEACLINKETPVILLTANAISGTKEQALADGFSGYISKPIDLHRLYDTIINFAEGSELVSEDEAAEAEKTAKLADAVKRLDFTEIRGIIG